MTSKKIDQFLLSLGVVLIIISSYQLFFSRLMQSENSGLSLGTLEQTQSVVKMKSTLALDWRDAYRGTNISEQQLIYTDSNSSAEIKFIQGHKVQIGENSLIRIASIGKGLNVQRGLIRARLEGHEPLVIEMNGEELTLSGSNADVQINIQGDVGEIGVISGQVEVEKEGQVEKLDKTNALKIENGELKKQEISVTLLSPGAAETFYSLESEYTVTFQWDPARDGEVIIADNSALKRARVFRGPGTTEARLSPGTYYWKVSNAEGSSLIGSFHIVREVAPVILRPLSGESFRVPRESGKESELFLQWKGAPGQEYLVEWEDRETHSMLTHGTGVLIPLTMSGNIRWRVKLSDEERTLAPWSEWQSVEVTLVDPPVIPVDLGPKDLELQSYSQGPQDVELTWTSSGPVEFELLDPKNSQTLISLEKAGHTLSVKDPGQYRWRLRSKDEFGRVSEWTEYESFVLEDLSHEVAEGFQRIQLKKPDQEVTFNWKALPGSMTVFELAEEKDFKEVIVKKEVNGGEVKVVVPKTGNYYWRSRQFNPDGTFHVSEPKKVIIEPAPAPAKPEKLPDLEVPLEWKETRYQWKWWHLILSEAVADDFKGIARIQIPEMEDASQFVIRIYKDEEGSELILEKTVEGNVLIWEGAKPGTYFWQYALVDYWGRQSPFSDLSRLSVVGSEPVLPEQPRLRYPIRAVEIDQKDLNFQWTHSERNKSYRLQIAADSNFQNIISDRITTKNALKVSVPKLNPGLYFWRVKATGEYRKEAISNTGRFQIRPSLEKISIVDKPPKSKLVKKFSNRLSLAWAPSLDTYDFKGEEKKGKIDGTTLNSVEARFFYFASHSILSLEILRQSGEVFKGEKYLFQRLLLNGTWRMNSGNHVWGAGVSVGQSSGYSYDISSDDKVSASSVAGLLYGPHLMGIYPLNREWEIQGDLKYLMGEIPNLEVAVQANRHLKNFYLFLGSGLSNREYKDNDGAQSSLRINVGLGKEF